MKTLTIGRTAKEETKIHTHFRMVFALDRKILRMSGSVGYCLRKHNAHNICIVVHGMDMVWLTTLYRQGHNV